MKGLFISKDLTLPVDFATQTAAILAKRRRGKTYTGCVIAEEMIKARIPFVAFDPTGVWWGLRASANGQQAGYPVTIIGGEHGDIPLERSAGAVIAELVVEHPGHYILDVSAMDADDIHFFAAEFGEALLRLKARQRSVLHLFYDEADMVLPQNPESKLHHRAMRATDKLLRQGGVYGLGVTLISQRPALINKNGLSQVEVLIALQLVGAQDHAAVRRWVQVHDTGGQAEKFMGSLASLGLGEAWVWSPSWLNAFKRVQVRPRETFNSSKTPEVGDRPAAPKILAAVDLAAVRARVAATIEKVQANDPVALKAKVAELQRQLAERRPAIPPPAPPPPQPKRVEVQVIKEQQLVRLEAALARAEKGAAGLRHDLACGEAAIKELGQAIRLARAPTGPMTAPRAPVAATRAQPAIVTLGNYAAAPLGRGELAVLTAVAQHHDQGGASREQLTVLTGYKRSSRDAYIQRLSAAGRVVVQTDTIRATQQGLADLGPEFRPLPTGPALRAHWLRELGAGERRLLEMLLAAYPTAVSRDELSDSSGYKRSSRDAYLQRLGARRLVEDAGRGEVRATALLFEESAL